MALLTLEETKKILTEAGFPIISSYPAPTLEDAITCANSLGYPLVLKFVSKLYTHKSDIGAVKTGISSLEALKKAFGDLEELKNSLDPAGSIVIEPMISGAFELFVGFKRDTHFGPILVFGLGGIMVELLKEVHFCLLPARDREILNMCRKVKGWQLLCKGFRNFPPLKEKMILDFLKAFSSYFIEKDLVKEVDLNPIMVKGDELVVVDARIYTT